MTTVASATASTSSSSTSTYSGLTTDDFIGIMLTELQNQDPTEPTKTADMVQSMREIQELLRTQQETERANLSWAASLVGQSVTVSQSLLTGSELAALQEDGLSPDVGASSATGVVTGYRVVDDQVWISVGGSDYPIDNVTSLGTGSSTAERLVELAAGLNGRTVTYTGSDGSTASGTVDGISVADDGTYVMSIGGDEIPFANLLSVG